MGHDAQLDLAVVGAGDQAAGGSHKGLAHAPALGGAHRDVLQVGLVAGQPPRDRHSLRIVGVYPAGARVRQLGQFVGVGALELGQAPMLQDLGRQRIVFGQLFQHFFVGAGCAGGGFLDHRQAELSEENLANLLRAAQVEGLACQGVGFALELQDALAQLMALQRQHGPVNQHAVALNAVQGLAAGDLHLVDKAQPVVGLQLGPKRMVDSERLVRVLARVFGGAGDIDLRERNLPRPLAAQVFIADTAAPQVAQSQAGQPVRLVHLEHIALQHGVVHIALHLDAVVGEYMAVILDVLAQLGPAGVLQPGFQAGQHLSPGQLLGRTRVVVGQRHIGGLTRLHRKAHAHDLGAHLIKRGGLGVKRHQICRLNARQPELKSWPIQQSVATQGNGWGHVAGRAWLARGRGLSLGFVKQAGLGWAWCFTRTGLPDTRGTTGPRQSLEAEFFIKNL